MKGVQLTKNKNRNCLFLIHTYLLDKFLLARTHYFKNTQFNNIANRPRWRETDFLELIHYETIYENEKLR